MVHHFQRGRRSGNQDDKEMKINKDFTIEGWNPEEHVDKMIMFHNNEVSPRIKKHLNPDDDDFYEKYKEAVLLGSDLYKMKASNLINNTQVRIYLDQHIGKLHNK